MDFDTLILAGGRSSRLGGAPKSELVYDGGTLLERTIHAARGSRNIVIVGPVPEGLPAGVHRPAAAIAAGLGELHSLQRPGSGEAAASAGGAPFTLVLACDMPHADVAVPVLHDALVSRGRENTDAALRASDGVMAVSPEGRRQPLAGFYRTAALQAAVEDAAVRNELNHGSVFALLARLDVMAVTVPAGSTDDVDTWDDAAALGVDAGANRADGPAAVEFGGRHEKPRRNA
ncbi:MAG: molybdopterin-guanine dinucleotide biosynthesis protein [Arthrobacter sp.]|nr:molybdopterin-guanine dinucleotide biosynthesis protein [Arthrobacter sp.]